MQTCAGKEAPSLREASNDEHERASLAQKMQPEYRPQVAEPTSQDGRG
jgi:hypothetical protein